MSELGKREVYAKFPEPDSITCDLNILDEQDAEYLELINWDDRYLNIFVDRYFNE